MATHFGAIDQDPEERPHMLMLFEEAFDRTPVPYTDQISLLLVEQIMHALVWARGGYPDNPLANISVLTSIHAQVSSCLHQAVTRARYSGYSWPCIAESLASSPAAARRRYLNDTLPSSRHART